MDLTRLSHDLTARFGAAAVRLDEPLAPYTTLGVGGPADCLVTITRTADVLPAVNAARAAGLPVTVLGGGSNVVVGDRGIRGVVLRLHLTRISQPGPGLVRAEAGVTVNGLVRWTVSRGLAGLEAWAGTPGTVGGAVFGNAHFQGRDIGSLVHAVEVVTPAGEVATLAQDQLEFAYDTSRLRRTREIALWVELVVGEGHPADLRRTARASLAYRKQTQPLALPSAGCVFQNPDPGRETVPDGVPASAGALIDRARLKGERCGGARVSPVHANFIVNEGGATAADVRALVDRARHAVRDRFGVELRDEVVFLGEF